MSRDVYIEKQAILGLARVLTVSFLTRKTLLFDPRIIVFADPQRVALWTDGIDQRLGKLVGRVPDRGRGLEASVPGWGCCIADVGK